MKTLFIIGLIFLSINIFRFIIGNYQVLKSDQPIFMKIWNIIESIGISITLIVLILNYYK